MERTIFVRNASGAGFGVAITAEVDSVLVGVQGITANVIFTPGGLSVSDVTNPPSGLGFTPDLVVFGTSGLRTPTKIPVIKGETYYVRFSAIGSAILFLDDDIS
jgi:hypothetical protein